MIVHFYPEKEQPIVTEVVATEAPEVNSSIELHANEKDDILFTYKGFVSGAYYNDEDNLLIIGCDDTDYPMEMVVSLDDYDIPASFADYADNMKLYVDLECIDDCIIHDWYIIDRFTDENLGKPTNQDIIDRYDIELNHEIINVDILPEIVYLSQLKENTIYSYTTAEGQDYPQIINDSDEECILYTKHNNYEDGYGMYACPSVMYEPEPSIFTCSVFLDGEKYNIMYTKSDYENLYKLAETETVNVSELANTDSHTIWFKYIYNDTDEEQTLSMQYDYEGKDIQTVKMAAHSLIGCWGPAFSVTLLTNS